MDDRLSIQLNNKIQTLIEASSYRDVDDFGVRLSRNLAGYLAGGRTPAAAMEKALAETKSKFFTVNRLRKSDFKSRLCTRLIDGLPVQPQGSHLLQSLREFTAYAERQLAGELWKGRHDEGVLRSHVQTFLQSRGRETLKELVTGRGRTDIALVDEGTREVIEVKLWRGQAYLREGLVELSEYLRTERLEEGYCVVLDCSLSNEAAQQGSATWTEKVEGRAVHVIVVWIRPSTPSKLQRDRRKAASP